MMSKILLLTPAVSLAIIVAAESEPAAGITAWVLPLVIIGFLIAVNGLYVAAEFAIIGSRPSQVETLADEGDPQAEKLLEILVEPEKQDRYIATAQLGITIASLGLGMYAEPAIAHLIEPYLEQWFNLTGDSVHTVSYILVLSLLTYLHMVIGEMVPKAIALSNASSTAIALSGPMRLSQLILAPLVGTLNAIGNMLLKLLQLPPAQPRPHSTEEIEQIVSESAESGLLNEEEEEIILNIFDFGDRRVGQVMTPRPRVEAMTIDMPVQDMMRMAAQSNHTRFPIYEDNRDRIVGILHMRDLVAHALDQQAEFEIRQVMSPVPVVPQDELVEDLLALFRRERIHMAVVIDEVGGLAGVVTLEDLIEEVVGEVRDEFDIESEPFIELDVGLVEVSGTYLLSDLLVKGIIVDDNSELPDVETIGGVIVTIIGRPPVPGDGCKFGHAQITVVSVDGLAVERARIHFPPQHRSRNRGDYEGHEQH